MTSDTPAPSTGDLFEAALERAGEPAVRDALSRILNDDSPGQDVLTIVTNEGVHHLPDAYRRGVVYVASRGSLDFSSIESIHAAFRHVLSETASVLKSRSWRRVYLVPFGPAPLSMQIKLLVYRVTGLESVDVMHVSHGPRVDVDLSLREIIVSADPSTSIPSYDDHRSTGAANQ